MFPLMPRAWSGCWLLTRKLYGTGLRPGTILRVRTALDAADPAAIAAMLDAAVAEMQDRAGRFPAGSATIPRPSRTRSTRWCWSMRWRS